MQHLISWNDWTDDKIQDLLDFAVFMKTHRYCYNGAMQGRSIAALFQKTSTRTRVSFEAAMTEMGGHAIYIDWRSSNFELTDYEFESSYLSRNVALIVARMKKHEDLLRILGGASVPVVNGCCNLFHPCQSLADLLTIRMDRGKLDGAVLCYVGVHNNVANSLVEICAACNVHLVLVTPIANEETVSRTAVERATAKGILSWETDLAAAVRNSDYVYTDTWVDMEFFEDPAFAQEKKTRIEKMMPYQLTRVLLADSKAKVMHDMPIHAGYEIEYDLVTSDRSIIFEQAENRLDAQKAIIVQLLDRVDV